MVALCDVNLAKLELHFSEFPSCLFPSRPQEELTQGFGSEN